ncbi:MHYT domain-containing protein [Massilia cavernae]|uniref:Virulence sensor protein BvgS n=1 Tax=Massilia cavernae TaxID=2320864 RepID=A0A418XRW4_9BURK|nr:MHYT domain-containing protein [Massilia cavernae]RJG15280.1 PAS domain S-box protein [Massilia cavernae]
MLSLFTVPADPTLLSYGQYDPKLVVLSFMVAIFASWMGLQIAGQASANPAQRAIVLATGSLALGAGVWAMHFVGMLAFNLCTRVEYDPMTTIGSALPSIGASLVALSLIARERIGPWTLLAGGVLVGAGIGAMHYSGMAGMRMGLELRYDPLMFGLSIVVAVVLATLALWVRFGLSGFCRLNEPTLLLAPAVVMGCAIAGMHYTGMAAARFVGTVAPGAAGSSNSGFLAVAISLITVAFTIFVLAANGLLRYRRLFLELSASQEWMRAMLATAVDGVITVDRDGRVEEFNASAEKIFGWRRDEIAGRHVRLLVPDNEVPEGAGLLGYLNGGSGGAAPTGAEVMAVRKDGSPVPIRCSLGHAKMGKDDLFICFVTDITERRAMMQALSASEQQFRSLIGNIPGISYHSLLDGEYPMLFISDAAERVTGYAPEDFLGTPPRRTFGSLIHAADRARVWEEVQAALRDDRPYLVEYRLLHADGSIRWLWENGTCVRDETGALAWLDGVILDISERREMEEALRSAKVAAEQAAAARATFVANMSHEIRTPMNSILGFTDVLLDGDLAPDQRSNLDTIRSAGRALLRLLNEILDTAKLEKGVVELELHDFNLLSLIDELSSTLGAAARAKGLHVDIHYDAALPASIHGDELRIRQVLTNLLDNAIKFTARGSVTLCAGAVCDQLHIEVRDTGIGIAPERMKAVFDPFIQADASMTRRFGGIGLGTTISKQLVELMKGRIWAESVEGEGSTFHVLLPLEAARVLGLGAAAFERDSAALKLQVFDRETGLRRWGGNSDAYSGALGQFRNEHAQLAATLQAHAAGTEWNALRMLTHRARGTAANLGLVRLAAVLAQLEEEAGADGGATASTLAQAVEATGAALDAIRPGRTGAAAAAAGRASAADLERARREGEQLMQALRRGALDDDALSGLEGALRGHPAATGVARLQAALADFDFELARKQLREALAGLDDARQEEAR